MPTGDGAALFWGLVTLAATFGVGAYQLSGAKARNLWLICALLAVLAVVLGFGVASWASGYVAAALRALWVAYPLVTVVVVSLIVREKRQPKPFDISQLAIAPEDMPPSFAAGAKERNKWTPDTPFRDALAYFGVNAAKPGRTMTVDDGKRALIIELWTGKVAAWGKAHPTDEELVQIKKDYWDHAAVTLQTNYAFSASEGVGIYDVHLSKAQMELAWPPKSRPGASA